MSVIHFLLYLFFVASVRTWNFDDDDSGYQPEVHRKMLLNHLTKNQTVLVNGFHLVTRQVATNIYMFRSYRSVSVIFFPIMRDVTEARFTFQAEELHMNNLGSCQPREVIIDLKRSSFPAVNPDKYDFPKDFIDPSLREPVYTQEILSDAKNNEFIVKNPKPGNWYALVYRSWEDPRHQEIVQQGLVPNCNTVFYTDLQVKREDNVEDIDCYSELRIDYRDLPADFKCIAVDSTDPISLNVTINNTPRNGEQILVAIQALSLPTEKDYLVTCAFDPKLSNYDTITFTPNPNAWHYIQLSLIANSSNYANCESYHFRTDLDDDNVSHSITILTRDDKGRFFSYDYGLPTNDIQDTTSLINITSGEIKSVKFKVNPFVDIGGTLVIEASLLMSLKYYMGYKRQLNKGGLLGFTQDNQYFRTVICMDIGHTSIPLSNGQCKYNDKVKPALFVLNSTDSDSIYGKILIPYPESGTWYLTFRLFCDEVVCPCLTSHNETRYYVDYTGVDKEGGENISEELSNITRAGETNCNATVVLAVSSSSCVNGMCSNHGSCLLNTMGGMVMSFCFCVEGYGGWDCSDDSRMYSRLSMLLSVLALTLSNIFFVFSIYIAVIRLYYTEAVMYAFTFIISTFYHACDASPMVRLCIIDKDILQFSDFYCGNMCFWVTLLAMSIISKSLKSAFQLIGAVVIAMLTTWNMHSIVAFMVPAVTGASILLASWAWDYKATRKLKYPKKYYIRHLPFGLLLVSVGLICFAFLQTTQNYMIVHSFWHAIIAVSVAFLLPDVNREGSKNAFLPTTNYFKLSFRKFFKRPQANSSAASVPRAGSPVLVTTETQP